MWKFHLLFSLMIIWNYKYLVSLSVFFLLLNLKNWMKKIHNLFLLWFIGYLEKAKDGSCSQCHSEIKKLSLLLHHVYDLHENIKKCRKKWNKPRWFHLQQAKNNKQVSKYAEFLESDRHMQRCVNNKGGKKIKILYYTRWQRWRCIKIINTIVHLFSNALLRFSNPYYYHFYHEWMIYSAFFLEIKENIFLNMLNCISWLNYTFHWNCVIDKNVL